MQPGRSQLSVSLKPYLNNKNRLQPIIGLGSITECVNVGSEDRETLYLCEVCVCRLTKADIRNHILGSHHRFNYIKSYHPLSVCKWQESYDLSKLAWPLMELAKTLEVKEGPGDVQLLEVPDALYQTISTASKNNAAALINALKDEAGEPGCFSEATSLHYPSESQRIVLCPHKQGGASEVFDSADVKPYEISARMESPPLIPANPTPESKVCLNDASTWIPKDVWTLPEPSEKNNCFGDMSGSNPLIGLVRVDELRGENGSSYGFLCHCCRIRSNKRDIYDHLTSYSHLSNYLMEIQPDLVDIMNEDTEANFQLLGSLADQVEQQEGRGEPKIVNVPESFCRQITGKSYHWCLRMLSNGWVNTNIQTKREPVQGVTKHPAFTKIPVVMSKPAKREKPKRKKKKKKKKTDPMFNVSFPLREGAMLLERTCFRKDSVFEMASPSLSDPDPVSSPLDTELKCDEASFENNDAEGSSDLQTCQLEQDLRKEDVDSVKYVPETNIIVTVFQDAEGSDGVNFNQSGKETEAGDLMVYGRQDGSQRPFQNWQSENVYAERGGTFPAASHNEDWRPYKPYYRQEEGSPNGWYSSASVQTGVEDMRQMNGNYTTSCSAQHYPHQDQQMAWGDAGSGTGGTWGHPDLPSEVDSFIEAARTNVQTMHRGSIASEPGVSFYETDPRQTGTGLGFNWYYADPQNYNTQPAAVQVGHVNQMFNCQNTGPSTHPAWYGAFMQPNGFSQPGPAVYYSTGSFQNWGLD
ncbi:uncharacterized protein LOC106515772 [Austrofundulus limnaeus]|uniref:Uncharacterized protein LOC106515772 n=1 Tax=Austrofundulus limnaeus TaxID=52670 RepID=A0A2I4B0E2_AUSLI|nr:PREDICTED: uncharacterized protein LOC106515772 [Austrofundulus limnaeus]